MKRNFRRNGFTLLEMSIVIVVVGLLVGGLVGARGYIKNAQLVTLMNESKFYINAFGQFEAQYNAVPGDMRAASGAWPMVFNGDGNGAIRAGTYNSTELFRSFQHLAASGLIAGQYSGISSDNTFLTTKAKAGLNVPAAVMNGVAYLLDHPDPVNGNVAAGDPLYFSSGTPDNSGLYGHVLRVAGLPVNATGLPGLPFLTPKQTYQIDSKFDDGNPAGGWVMTGNATSLPDCTLTDFTGTYRYKTTYTGPSCFLILRIQ